MTAFARSPLRSLRSLHGERATPLRVNSKPDTLCALKPDTSICPQQTRRFRLAFHRLLLHYSFQDRVGRDCGENVHSCIRGRGRNRAASVKTPITVRAKLLDGRPRTSAYDGLAPSAASFIPDDATLPYPRLFPAASAAGTAVNTPSQRKLGATEFS